MLQFPLTGNDKRSCPPSNATDAPGTTSPGVSDFAGCARCFDYDTIRNPVASFVRQAFVNYALAVSLAFNATETLAIINFGADVNRALEDGCAPEIWASQVEFTQQVYATIKDLYPTMAVFPSFSLETMMQAQDGQVRRRPVPCPAFHAPSHAPLPLPPLPFSGLREHKVGRKNGAGRAAALRGGGLRRPRWNPVSTGGRWGRGGCFGSRCCPPPVLLQR